MWWCGFLWLGAGVGSELARAKTQRREEEEEEKGEEEEEEEEEGKEGKVVE